MTKDKKTTIPNQNSIEWNDYVLGLLNEDEKIDGNPTTDGLRRIFEIALNCTVTGSESLIVQSPSPDNEKRATVSHKLTYVLNDPDCAQEIKIKTTSGAADVYWGNCDKIYRNHPVAVAETRAEGRALRRALKLRKVVAAEEIANNIDDNIDGSNVGKISNNQINFVDAMAKRLNVNIKELFITMGADISNISNISHDTAVEIIRELSRYQQDISNIPEGLLGYEPSWR